MWLVLAMAIVAAAALDHLHVARTAIALGPPRSFGVVHLRLPVGWIVQVGSEDDPLVAFIAREPNKDSTGGHRSIRLYREHLRADIPPELYLMRTPIREEVFSNLDVSQEQTRFGRNRAILLKATMISDGQESAEIDTELVLCAMFPGHEAVTLRLSKNSDFANSDQILLNKIADSVSVDGGK